MKTCHLVPWLFAFVLCAAHVAIAQDVSNVRAFQENGKAVVVYDLLSTDPTKEFYVKLFCSLDGGKTFGSMLSQVTGDANTMVKAGMGKMASWDVLKESSSAKGDFVFRVDALSVGPNGVLPSVEERGVKVQFLDISRTNADVTLMLSITNKNPGNSQFLVANFLVVDDQDKICRDIVGDVGKLVVIPVNEKRIISITVKNVSPNAKAFSQFEFNTSGVGVKQKNLPILN
jgi:hypothetical protein